MSRTRFPARRADQAGGPRNRAPRAACPSPKSRKARRSASFRRAITCNSSRPIAPKQGLAARSGDAGEEAAGELVTTSGEVLGRHAGVHHFTVGQRRGLGIAAGRPLYVVQIDSASRRVIVGDEDELLRDTCEVRDVNWIAGEPPAAPVEALVKIRYRHEPAAASSSPRRSPRARALPRAAARHYARPSRGILFGRTGAGRRLDR